MKRNFFYVIIIGGVLLLLGTFSCTKDPIRPGSAAFTIVNAIVGSNMLVTNFSGNNGSKTTDPFIYKTALKISYGFSQEISSYTGTTQLSLSLLSDTLHSLYKGTFDLPVGSIHTLFLTGNTTQVDTLFTTDNPPYYPATDTVMGVRFVNLASSRKPININIQGSTGTPIIKALPYKGITGFQSLSAGSTISNYNFQIRDATSDSLLATYRLAKVLYKNQTLVFYGSASAGLSVMGINNY